jgi:hypothetical protein
MIEKRRKIRVGALIEDDKAGIDGQACDVDRVAVPSQPVIGFVKDDPMPLREQPRGGQAGNTTAHNGDIETLIGRGAGFRPAKPVRCCNLSGQRISLHSPNCHYLRNCSRDRSLGA